MMMQPLTEIKRAERTIAVLLILAIAPYLALLLFDIKSILTVIAGGVAMIVLVVVYQRIKKLRYLKLVEFEHQGHIQLDDRPDVLTLTLLEPMSDKTRRRIRHAAQVYCNKKPFEITYGSRQDVRAKNESEVVQRLFDSSVDIKQLLPESLISTITKLHAHYQAKPDVSYGRSAFYYRDLRLVADLLDDFHSDVSASTQRTVDESIALLNTKLHDVQRHINGQKTDNLIVAADVLSADSRYY